MFSRLLSIIFIILAGIAVLLFVFSDDIIKKKDELMEQAKSTVKEQKENLLQKTEEEVKKTFENAEEALKQNIAQ